MAVMGVGPSNSQQWGLHGLAFVAWMVFVLAVLPVGAVLVHRGVKRHGGPAMKAALLVLVFWPAGIYVWAQARRRRVPGRWPN